MDKDNLKEESIKFIKNNKKLLIDKFINPMVYFGVANPATIFMAGSPGAGKTETARELIKKFNTPIVNIDADEIRNLIPGYNGANSDDVQGASALGVEKLYDHVLNKKLDAIVDGTLANYDVANRNIKRALLKSRKVAIFYVYQEPVLAWRFTKAREALEGRSVPLNVFVDAFFKSRDNANLLKKEFGSQIELYLIVKDLNNDQDFSKSEFNINNIDNYLKNAYTKESLIELLRE